MSDLYEPAVAYAARGWCIIPELIRDGQKRPMIDWKEYQSRRPEARHLRAWFANPKRAPTGMAVVCGAVSGRTGEGLVLVGRDFDVAAEYHKWARAHSDLAKLLPTIRTKRGAIVMFHGPEGFADLGAGEYRGTSGHVCVLPPSEHPKGGRYSWHVPLADGPLPNVPDPVAAGLLPAGVVLGAPDPAPEARGGQLGVYGVNGVDSVSQQAPTYSDTTIHDLSDEQLKRIERAIQLTLPPKPGTRKKKLFRFAQHLHGIRGLRDMRPVEFAPVVKKWHRLALPTIGTKPFADTWRDFLNLWHNVRFPIGTNPVDQAFERAKALPLPPETAHYDVPAVRLLAALCRELQRDAGDKPFHLACRQAAWCVDMNHVSVAEYLRAFAVEGLLLRTYSGDLGGNAAEYRYLGSM